MTNIETYKNVCARCREGVPLRRTPDGNWDHVHYAYEVTEYGKTIQPKGIPCEASKLRELDFLTEGTELQ